MAILLLVTISLHIEGGSQGVAVLCDFRHITALSGLKCPFILGCSERPLGFPHFSGNRVRDKLIVVCIARLWKPAYLGPEGALSVRVPAYSPTLRKCSASGAQRLELEPGVGLQPDSPGKVKPTLG